LIQYEFYASAQIETITKTESASFRLSKCCMEICGYFSTQVVSGSKKLPR